MAKAFCTKNYGINAVKELILEENIMMNIDKRRYKSVASGIISETYKKL